MFSRMLRFAILLAVVVAIIEALRRLAQPDDDTEPAAPTPWTPLAPSPGGNGGTTAGTAELAATPETSSPPPEAEPEPGASETPTLPPDATATPWVEADTDGACPASHPLKAKDSSKIVHQPGGLSYERTHADRCYVDLTAAEADGYRAAKR